MSLPVIVASDTSTNEPSEIIIFNKWWIENLHVSGEESGNVRGFVVLAKFGTKSDGSMVFNGEKINLTMENMLVEAQENELLANIIGGIIEYVGQKAISAGYASNITT